MEDVRNLTRICPICGKTIKYKEIYEDGRDWEGHQRGTPEYRKEGYHCTCDSTPFKRMCINCKYYKNYTCTNYDMQSAYKQKIENISPLVIEEFKLKVPSNKITMSCNYWELNKDVLEPYFEKK